ncbi:hypothetical protein NQ315_011278 [Exocentrus adspersus]|uniref:Uncharacterized protein n=1 Tax=Exocentrus adspersus TaxID=1586481 RepID=A0AAV8VJ93_9CUCU|nr:hypothetical protein NQ315_011278 [Exocentrus adspersus]
MGNISVVHLSNFLMDISYFLIVEFPTELDTDGSIPTATISSSWAFKDTNGKLCCWWPNFKSEAQRKNAIIHHKEVDIENCLACEIDIKYKTDINTEEENQPRKSAKRNLDDFICNTDTSPSISPPTPPVKKILLCEQNTVGDSQLLIVEECGSNSLTSKTPNIPKPLRNSKTVLKKSYENSQIIQD